MCERRYTIYQCYLIVLLFIMGTVIFAGCQFKTRNQNGPNWVDVPININEAKKLQEQVDNGHRPDLLDPHQIARGFLSKHLRLEGEMPLDMTGESSEGKLFRATSENNFTVELLLVQPVRRDTTGIWWVKKFRFSGGPNWVDVPININEVKELQEQVDDGHRVGLFDPRQIAREFLAERLGLEGDMPLDMTGESSEGKLFRATSENNFTVELLLVQPVRRDTTGIWWVKQYRFSKGK